MRRNSQQGRSRLDREQITVAVPGASRSAGACQRGGNELKLIFLATCLESSVVPRMTHAMIPRMQRWLAAMYR
jgi:hypothetical protein